MKGVKGWETMPGGSFKYQLFPVFVVISWMNLPYELVINWQTYFDYTVLLSNESTRTKEKNLQQLTTCSYNP